MIEMIILICLMNGDIGKKIYIIAHSQQKFSFLVGKQNQWDIKEKIIN